MPTTVYYRRMTPGTRYPAGTRVTWSYLGKTYTGALVDDLEPNDTWAIVAPADAPDQWGPIEPWRVLVAS